MRQWGLILFGVSLHFWPINGWTQANMHSGELFLGFSQVSGSVVAASIACPSGSCAVVTTPSVRTSFKDTGGQASITGILNGFAGLEADVDCCQRPGSLDTRQYTVLAGPRFVYRGNARLNPFAHVL